MLAQNETEFIHYQIALDLGYSWMKNPNGDMCFVSFRWKVEHDGELDGWESIEDTDVSELKDVPEYGTNPKLLYDDYVFLLEILKD